MIFYGTFGSRSPNKDFYVEIDANTWQDAHALMILHYGERWSDIHTEPFDFTWYSRGCLAKLEQEELNKLTGSPHDIPEN